MIWLVFSPDSITAGRPIGEVDAMTRHEAAVIWARQQHGDDSRAIVSGSMIGEQGRYIAMMPDGYSWKAVGQMFFIFKA